MSIPENTVRIYSPRSSLVSPVLLLSEMFGDLWSGRSLAWRLFIRDLNAQYRQTFLGYIWAFIPPLVASMPFIFLNSQGIVNVEGVGTSYAAFAMIGTLIWQTFVDALQSPVQSLMQAKPMLAKINFPREAILLAGIYGVFFNFCIRALFITAVMIYWGITPSLTFFFFPIAVLAMISCGTALGLVLAPVAGLYGDVGRVVPIFAQFLMLLTPVVYPAKTVGLAGALATWNPISSIVVTSRQSLTGQELSMLVPFFIVFACSLIAIGLGWVGFRIAMPHLISRMGG